MKKINLNINGMTCINCQNRIANKLRQTKGIIKAEVSYNDSYAEIYYNENEISPEDIKSVIQKLGYGISGNERKILYKISILISIIVIYILLQSTGILNFLVPSQLADSKMSYGMLFVIGLITSVHCVAMCGGINLSQSISDLKTFYPAVAYNFGRVLSYTIIGGFLGLAGFFMSGTGEMNISIFLQSALKITAGVFMVIMGANMLNLFSFLRRCSIRLPKFLSDKIFLTRIKLNNPFVIGLLNGIMPCGPLQSMWLVALVTCNPFYGAMSMLIFGMGTLPLMLGLGSIVSVLGRKFTGIVMTSGAVLVTVLGLVMISQGAILSGWFQNSYLKNSNQELKISDELQIIHSKLSSGKYPDIEVKAGVPVKWIIDAPKGSINGCNYKFTIQEYGIEHTFKTGENIINFIPTKTGMIYYNCWMGMIQGRIFIKDSI